MSYLAISLITATAGRHRHPPKRLQTVRRTSHLPQWSPGYLPCSSLTPLPLSSTRPSVSFGGFGLSTTQVPEPTSQTTPTTAPAPPIDLAATLGPIHTPHPTLAPTVNPLLAPKPTAISPPTLTPTPTQAPSATPTPETAEATVCQPAGSTETDRQALAAFYDATDGDNWVIRDYFASGELDIKWMTDAPMGKWLGIITNEEGLVTELDLQSVDIVGTIPPELGNLSALRLLNLQGNHLRGQIPSELGNLSCLEELHLYNNQFRERYPENSATSQRW